MKEIKLFDYQEDMKERIEKALRFIGPWWHKCQRVREKRFYSLRS